MPFSFQIAGTLALAATLALVVRSRSALRHTTLLSAWNWSLATVVVWLATWLATAVTPLARAGIADQLWYATAVLGLCPPVAVLGAKRPGARVWTWFILGPLLLVLGWPALALLLRGKLPPPELELAAPAMVGYVVVLIMGVGNYLGTRFAMSAVLYGVALLLVTSAFYETRPAYFPATNAAPAWGTLCLAAAVLTAALRRPRRLAQESSPYDRVWRDFRDYFGFVWARRIQDRFNAAASAERLPTLLTSTGIVWAEEHPSTTTRENAQARIEHRLRWLLRRFVDPEWIDSRLGIPT